VVKTPWAQIGASQAIRELESELGGTVCYLEGASGSTHNLTLACDEASQRIKQAVRDSLTESKFRKTSGSICAWK
jgi:hypothetical protein